MIVPVVTCTGEIEVEVESDVVAGGIETERQPCGNEIRYLGSRTSVTCPECDSVTGVGGPRAAREIEITMSDLRERRAERREMLGYAFSTGGVPR